MSLSDSAFAAVVLATALVWGCDGGSKGGGGGDAGAGTGGSAADAGGTDAGDTDAGGTDADATSADGAAGSADSGSGTCVLGNDDCFHTEAHVGTCIGIKSLNGTKSCAEYFEGTSPDILATRPGACEQGGKGRWSTTERCPSDALDDLPLIGCCTHSVPMSTLLAGNSMSCRYAVEVDTFWHDSECETCGRVDGCFTDYQKKP